jgi:hypothetical protein
MSLERGLAKAFGLSSEDAWRRHANPWSIYTRIPIPALLVAAIWTRTWIGWWSLVAVSLCLVWIAGCTTTSVLSRYQLRHKAIDEVVDVGLQGGPDHELGQTSLQIGVEPTMQV